jgi:hypothetical protein
MGEKKDPVSNRREDGSSNQQEKEPVSNGREEGSS